MRNAGEFIEQGELLQEFADAAVDAVAGRSVVTVHGAEWSDTYSRHLDGRWEVVTTVRKTASGGIAIFSN
jgi:hypothetical protein